MPKLVCDPFNYAPHSPRDLNLSYWEIRIPWTKTYHRCLRANFESNDSYEPVHCPVEKYVTFRTPQFPSMVSLYPSECATIVLGHPKSALSPFNGCGGPRGAFFRVTLPWHIGWNRWTVLKPYILLQCHKIDLRYLKKRIISIECLMRRPSIIAALWLYILHIWFQYRSHFENMNLFRSSREASDFLGHQQSLAKTIIDIYRLLII